MSETVHYIGKLTEIKSEYYTVDEIAKAILIINDAKPSEFDNEYYQGSHKDMVCDKFSDEYLELNGKLYSYTQESIEAEEDIMRATIDNTGVISYEVKYYNGGCAFQEALEESINNIK
jgi:hypothetical protein